MDARRRDACLKGRDIAADLTDQYRQLYSLPSAPAPALVIDEILTDLLGAKLSYDPLPPDRYAQTRWVDGRPIVTINACTDLIPGVKDPEGVQRVAAWHEAIHVIEDRDEALSEAQRALPGMEEPPPLIAFRDQRRLSTPSLAAREFRAEEAGRAAAVSIWAVERQPAWQLLQRLALDHPDGEVFGRGWRLLYEVAEGIGVNISALVKQLRYDRRIVVDDRSRRLWVPKFMPLGDEE